MKIQHIVYFLCLLLLPAVWSGDASAVSTSGIIKQIQTGGVGSGTASEEIVVIQNVSANPLNISNWCLQYSAATNGTDFTTLGCMHPSPTTELWLEAGGIASFASEQFSLKYSGFVADFAITAGMAAGGGHVRIVDSNIVELDRLGWGSAARPETSAAVAPPAGKVLSRSLVSAIADTDNNQADFSVVEPAFQLVSGVYEIEVQKDICANLDGLQIEPPEGSAVDESGDCMYDLCSNVDGLQSVVPAGYELDQDGDNCQIILMESRPLLITEILPNAESFDDGLEFIEIYNPNDSPVSLVGYSLALGPAYEKSYTFGTGEILPGQYIAISDIESGIILPNTSASVRLLAPAGNLVDESPAYTNPEENHAWALIENMWTFTDRATPGGANSSSLEVIEEGSVLPEVSVQASCPAGKYRSLETNRCRAVMAAVSSRTECPVGQSRNPVTNRCKAVSGTSLATCKEGQERNPATNRCRSISGASVALSPCKEGEERNPATNRCKKKAGIDGELSAVEDVYTSMSSGNMMNLLLIIGLLGCALAYVGYEWRSELIRKGARLKSAVFAANS